LAKSVDWTCLIGLDAKRNVCVFERFQKSWLDTTEIIRRIVGTIPCLTDSTGIGDSILESLQKDRRNFEGFKFTSPSKQQLMESLALAIQKQEIGFPEGVIANELESFEYEYTRTGVKYSAPSGMHDDAVCALALANFHKPKPVARFYSM
jgi:hypothetical protein